MTEQEFWDKHHNLEQLMEQGDYIQADPLCRELDEFLTNNQLIMVEADSLKQTYAQMNAVMVAETNTITRGNEAIKLLQAAGECAYSVFLQARLYWMQGKYHQALALLEQYFMVESQEDGVVIAANSPYHVENNDTKERILNLLAHCYRFYGLTLNACSCYLLSSQVVEYFPAKLLEYSNYLFNAHYLFLSKEEYYKIHLGYNDLFTHVKRYKHDRLCHKKHKKIRIGYISPDFRHHVVLLFIWAMLTQYDKERFQVYCFSNVAREDDYSQYIQKHVDAWFRIADLSAAQAAELVYQQEIDILVELAGHSQNNCLPVLAYKPAPIQVCGIGYFATTGLKTVDYFLTDKYLVNENTHKYFSEKLMVLPHSHFCYVPLKEAPALRGAPCKKNGYITFGSFNNLTKVNDQVLAVWAVILQQVPNAKLLLKASQIDDQVGCEIFRAKLLSLGVSEERFELRGFSFPYLQEYYDMDIALDTFPYPGGGTTCDALYMGVPVVTLGDGSHGGDFGISLLSNIGLEGCCAFSLEEYVEKAVMLASDYDLLEALHLGLRNMLEHSPVMDKKGYMTDLEKAYQDSFCDYVSKRKNAR